MGSRRGQKELPWKIRNADISSQVGWLTLRARRIPDKPREGVRHNLPILLSGWPLSQTQMKRVDRFADSRCQCAVVVLCICISLYSVLSCSRDQRKWRCARASASASASG